MENKFGGLSAVDYFLGIAAKKIDLFYNHYVSKKTDSKFQNVYFPENPTTAKKLLNVLSCINADFEGSFFTKVEVTLTPEEILQNAKSSLPSIHLSGEPF